MRCSSCREFIVLGSARFCPHCGATVEPPDADPMLGTLVGGRYRITELIAEGGMGRVYAAEQMMGSTVRKVAVKLLVSEYSGREHDMRRFARECSTVAELEHPNTIRFYDYGETDDGDLYIAMEFLAGRSLAKLLRDEGPMPPDRVDRIVGQICGSLDEAHGRGIVHRDLKPDNIVLTSPGGQSDFVKVLDFGIAKRTGGRDPRLTPLGVVLGSPPYMSPEQFTLQDVDPRSDIYSLAVVAYEMLTGTLPFRAADPLEWATLHLTGEPHPMEKSGLYVPPPMRAAVLHALSKQPSDRPATMRAFYGEFSLGGGTLPPGRPVSVAPPGASQPPGRWVSELPGAPVRPISSAPAARSAAPQAARAHGGSSPPRSAHDDSTVPPTVREPAASSPELAVEPSAGPVDLSTSAERAPRGTIVMARGGESSRPPALGPSARPAPLLGASAKARVQEATPPTVRDAAALEAIAAGVHRRGWLGWAIAAGLVVLAALGAVGVWAYVSSEAAAPKKKRAAEDDVVATGPKTAPDAPPTPVDESPRTPGTGPAPSASATQRGPLGTQSPCDSAIFAAVAGHCDMARRAYARCPASSPHHASASRSLEGLCSSSATPPSPSGASSVTSPPPPG
jgi:eukaryotic-like serine/threonine-protein kinase